MAPLRFVIADVFTDRPLAGNQLAVFTDARDIPEDRLQQLAKEIGFSETVFVYPPGWRGELESPRTAEGDDQPAGHVRIRIFTPAYEVPFAGHPCLGTAFVLGGPLQVETIRLETGRGIVPVHLEREQARIVFGRMEQPLPAIEPYEDGPALLEALGVERSELPIELYDNGIRHVYVCLSSTREVAELDPDFQSLARVSSTVAVNCFAGEGLNWKTRMFAPSADVAEDPATGSAAGPLALHLTRHGLVEWGEQIEISQGAELGRPSTLYAVAIGSGDVLERIEVGGSAVVVARGEFRLAG